MKKKRKKIQFHKVFEYYYDLLCTCIMYTICYIVDTEAYVKFSNRTYIPNDFSFYILQKSSAFISLSLSLLKISHSLTENVQFCFHKRKNICFPLHREWDVDDGRQRISSFRLIRRNLFIYYTANRQFANNNRSP